MATSGYIKGITIEFGANTTELNNALKKTQGALGKTQTELKAIDRALKFNPRNTTLLKQKFDLLKSSVDQTENKLRELKAMQKSMIAAGVDKTSAQYRELEREIIKTENNLEQAKARLKEFGSVGKQQAKAVGDAFKNAGAKIKGVGQSMTTNVTLPLVAGFTASGKYASDFEENLNKIDVAFGKSSKAVKNWSKTASKEFGLSQVQATGSASAFGALAKGIGLSDSEAAKMSTSLAGLSADLGSYFNMSNEESAKALEGIFTGESEALKRFGVVMLDTNLKKFAADQGLVWDSMTEGEKATLRYQYVLEKTKDAQGDYSRTSDGTANSIKTFQASIQDLAVSIGTVLLPMITPIIQKITEWINKFNQLSPTVKKVVTVIGIIVAAIGPLLVVIGSVASAIGSIISIAPVIGAALSALAGPVGIAIAIIAGLATVAIIVYKNWDKLKAWAAAVWGNITATVSKAAATLKNGVTTNFNALKNSVSKTWNKIKQAITKPITQAKNTVTKIVKKIKSLFPVKIGRLLKNIKTPHFSLTWGSKDFGKLGSIKYPKGFGVKWYKEGGIFDGPSIVGVGEAGPEAVLPIDKLQAMLNASNSQLVSALVTALRIANTGDNGGQYEITVNLGGAKVATEIFKLNKQGQLIMGA